MDISELHIRRFDKVLIANRGEIAMRILRACHELGLTTVAIYSDADRNAPHVRFADEAYHIGPSTARDSYLVIDKIIDIAKRSGAEAVHPGYGFLAENAEFARACYEADLVFVGPPPKAIEIMGDKATARSAVSAAGVPVIPGTEPGLNEEELLAAAQEIGFPVMVKASAGGGGKGMRSVQTFPELADAVASAKREAMAAFGDDSVYLEKMVMGSRHIEIQILADGYGNVVSLGERECSLQRRHQKLIEEAPSIFVDEDLRQRMGEVSIAAAEAVGYVNAGTIEFLVDSDKNFYFLEMNTRLQVEHPVTELVTGVDIVQEQLRVARGRRLSFSQEDVTIQGWAIECRINAEDPYNNYLPSTGLITTSQLPTGPGVRVDTGVFPGIYISPYYDPMISKLICYGKTRAEAVLRMRRALNEYRITGVKTNVPFHQRMMDSHRFMSGKFDIEFVENQFSMTDRERPYGMEAAILVALAYHEQSQRAAQVVRAGTRETANWKWYDRMR